MPRQLLPPAFQLRITLCGLLALVALGLALPAPPPAPGLWLATRDGIGGVAAEKTVAGGSRPYQHIRLRDGVYQLEFGYLNYNRDPLRLLLNVPAADLPPYRLGYGYAKSELAALVDWQKQALDEVYRTALEKELSQEEYDRLAADVREQYRRKHREFLLARGFKYVGGNTVSVDIPRMAAGNVRLLREVAVAIDKMARETGYDTDNILASTLAMVQTALQYTQIPVEVEGRTTGGVSPPLVTLVDGKGDCDSKTALLAAILLNWDRIRLVGVGVPNHYLLGVLRNPAKGEAYIEYAGLRYVLMEPAGPGWLPLGAVSPETLLLLGAGSGVSIEPLSAD